MCGGSSTTTQQVTIPQQVLDRYTSVNDRAQQVANTPFQVYSTDPNSFVAPLNDTQQAGVANTNAAAGQAQPYYDAATGQLINAQTGAQGYYDAAGGLYSGALAGAQPYMGAAGSLYTGALASAEPALANAFYDIQNAPQTGAAYVGLAGNTLARGMDTSAGLAGASLASLQGASQAAAPLQSSAAQNISRGLAAAQPYNYAAGQQIGQGISGAQPLNAAANQNITGAQAGAQPYQQLATQLGLGGAQAVNPTTLDSGAIGQYLNPYLNTVLNSTSALLNQQNQQQQSGQLGNAIRSGAFGGDRAGIAAANLAQQQQLANANVLSGILSQGYGQALSTAQQQQGLGLSAEQANRAALQAASGQLQSIGQQGFGQGITTAQQQAALGNQLYAQGLGAGQAYQGLGNQIYGQNTGTGQAQAALGNQLYTQGANTAAQQAALGNQLFQQGLAASGQQADFGNQLYTMGSQTGLNLANLGQLGYNLQSQTGQNLQGLGQLNYNLASQTGQNLQGLGQAQYQTGANTSQQLAGLGAGAQAAALQGAQAQLAAGQVGQQTQQAGLTALYNQFLQQQSYPFQVAQFLANIAEGTGALSGSTTTTTQPGGFFSDERLKEGVQPIGETYDGLKVVKYRYKGDPTWRVGFIAQDVEKKHPGAVGERQGYKTVDYGKASEAAAQRGHFARGGFADGGLAGFDPQLMQQLLSNQNGMYGPYMTGAGGPYGGLARVPAANLPVGQLKTAGAIPEQKTALQQLHQAAQLGDDVAAGSKDAAQGWDWLKKHMPRDAEARGGLARAHYAFGGDTPYENQEAPLSLAIPNDKPDVKSLQTPGSAPKGGPSGLDDTKDAAEAALAVAKLVAMLKTGGRVRKGYAEGGDPEDDLDDGVEDFARSVPGGGFQMVYKPTDNTSLPQIKAGQVTPHQIGDAALGAAVPGLGVLGQALRLVGGVLPSRAPVAANSDAPPAKPAPVRHPSVSRVHRHAGLAPANEDAANDVAPPGLAAAQPMPDPETVDEPAVTLAPVPQQPAGLAATPQTLAKDAQGAHADPSLMERLQSSPLGDYFSGLKHGDVPTWVSLLSGLGAAGTYPTMHPLVALAAGLSGGARGYMGAKEAQAGIGKTQAETAHTQAQANLAAGEAYRLMQINAPAGQIAVPGVGPKGEHFTGYDGKPWHYELQVNATDFGAPGTPAPTAPKAPELLAPSSNTDAYMASQYHIDPNQPAVANHQRALAMNPELAPLDDAARASVQARIGNLQDVDNQHRQLLQLSEAINDLSHGSITGQGHGSQYRARLANIYTTAANLFGLPVDPSVTKDVADSQIIAKIKELAGVAMAHQNNERAASIAHAITGVLPGGDLQPEAANELLSQMLVQTQQPRDLSQYANNYTSKYGLAVNLEPAFQKDMGPTYDHEQRALSAVMASPVFAAVVNDLQSADAKVRERAIRALDAKYGPGFHRYFTGGQ